MPAVKDVDEPSAGEPHARFDEAAGGIRCQWPQCPTALAPPADPTLTPTSLRLPDQPCTWPAFRRRRQRTWPKGDRRHVYELRDNLLFRSLRLKIKGTNARGRCF
jgi:hypothetical protein